MGYGGARLEVQHEQYRGRAALPQFDRIDEKLDRRTRLAKRYDERMGEVPGVIRPGNLPNAVHSRHVYPIRVAVEKRDRVIESLKSEQVGCVVNYRAVHLMQFFREKYGFAVGDFPVAERIGNETISLPFYPDMPLEDVDVVAAALERALARNSPDRAWRPSIERRPPECSPCWRTAVGREHRCRNMWRSENFRAAFRWLPGATTRRYWSRASYAGRSAA